MTTITWDQIGSRQFETGIDRGVLFLPEGGDGIAWNGLISVVADLGGSSESVIFDGQKINELTATSAFSGTLRAYTYPEEFHQFEGSTQDDAGFMVTGQEYKRFHLCYRTMIGDGTASDPSAYKIHILYDVTAIPSTRTYRTLSLETEPLEFEWSITATPRSLAGYKATAHIIVDSRKVEPWFLNDLEEVLYGTDISDPYLPALESLAAYIRTYDRVVVFDGGDGTFDVSTTRLNTVIENGDGTIDFVDCNVEIIDADSYTISSDDKELNLWQQ